MKKKLLFILLLILLVAFFCTIGVSSWIISKPVSITPNWEKTNRIPVYINKFLEFDYNANGIDLTNINNFKIKNKNGEDVVFTEEDIEKLSITDAIDATSKTITTLDIGNTYKLSISITFKEYSKYILAGTYTENANNTITTTTSQNLFVKYKTVQLGSGTLNDGAVTNGVYTYQLTGFSSDSKFYTIEDALATASANQFILVRANTSFTSLSNDETGYDDTGRTVKANTTLVLPYAFDGSTATIDVTNRTFANSALANDGYKKLELTIPENITLTNNGKIVIGGSTTGGNGGHNYAGATTSDYAQITLGDNAKIESSGDINAYGFIMEANSGKNSSVEMIGSGTLLMPLIIMEHRGGTAFAPLLTVSKKGMPFNQFFFQNVTPKLTINKGAKLEGLANFFMNKSDTIVKLSFIGNTNDYFLNLSDTDSKSIFKYNLATSVTTWNIYGNANLNALSLSLSGYNINTKDYLLPISWYWDVHLYPATENGTASVNSGTQSMKIMPQGKFTIHEGVTLTMPNIFIYDSTDDTGGAYTSNAMLYKKEGSGMLKIDGTLNVNSIGGYVKTSTNISNAKLNISGSVSVSSNEVKADGGVLNGGYWNENTNSLEGDIYYYTGNLKNITMAKGEYTSKNGGWITAESEFQIDYEFKYFDSDGITEITPDDKASPNNPTQATINGITLKDPTLIDFNFDGWYSDETLTNRIESISGNKDRIVTAYGKFIKGNPQYQITYIYNDTINGETTSSVTFEISKLNEQQLKNDLTTESHNFAGWYSDESFTNKVTTLTEDLFVNNKLTLYAKWEIKTFTLTINFNSDISTIASFSLKITRDGREIKNTTSKENYSLTLNYGDKIELSISPGTYKFGITYTYKLNVSGSASFSEKSTYTTAFEIKEDKTFNISTSKELL